MTLRVRSDRASAASHLGPIFKRCHCRLVPSKQAKINVQMGHGLLPTIYVVRREVMFHRCLFRSQSSVSSQVPVLCEGGGTPSFPMRWGYPILPYKGVSPSSLAGKYPHQVPMVGPWLVLEGVPPSHDCVGVPPQPGLEGVYHPPSPGLDGGTLPWEQLCLDRLGHSLYASSSFPQEDFLVWTDSVARFYFKLSGNLN